MKLVKVRWYRNGHKHETWEFPEHNLGDAHDRDLETADFAVPDGWEKGFDRVDRPHMYGRAVGEIGTDESGSACIEYEDASGELVRIQLKRI